MSVITRTRRPVPRPSEAQAPAAVGPRPSSSFLVAEAPDRGDSRTEAPESYRGRPAEAPDAGESRGGHRDQDFTHGRSQS